MNRFPTAKSPIGPDRAQLPNRNNITQSLFDLGVIQEGLELRGNGIRQSRSLQIYPNAAYAIGMGHDWHIREETDAAAFSRLINAHRTIPLARLWGYGDHILRRWPVLQSRWPWR
jgi:hypothetical protein